MSSPTDLGHHRKKIEEEQHLLGKVRDGT
jgi:hypothetical protein